MKSTATSDFLPDLSLSQGMFPNGDLMPSKVSPFGVIGDSYLNNVIFKLTALNFIFY